MGNLRNFPFLPALGVAGLLLGVVYLVVKRNLWVLVIAHGMIDMLDFVQTYFSEA
jgi:membrane protease YdiL (CAAX protease family)